MSIHVQLERFEGPLGLLLHLIREQEMDVFNINVHEITRQYLEYIKTMRRLDLEVAGEFVAMAATLIHIKSKMLLPQYNEEGEEIKEDPRKELVQKLVEYKRFQELSGELYKRPLLGRDVLTRAERETFTPVNESELVLAENPLFSLIAAYRHAIKSMKVGVHKVSSELQSIASRILEMKDLLVIGKRILFRELLKPDADVKGNHVLVTFLSLLELAKMGFVSVFQNEPLADIHVEPKLIVDGDVVSRVESYDSVNAAVVAESIMSDAQLSLNEPTSEAVDESEAPVVQEAYADAASDDDIAAEEARLFANSEVDAAGVAEAPLTDVSEMPFTTFTDFAEHHAALAPVEMPIVDESFADETFTTGASVDEGFADQTEADDEVPVAEALAALSTEAPAPPEPRPEPVPETQAQKVSSALSAALTAFDAFEDIADPDRSSEVES